MFAVLYHKEMPKILKILKIINDSERRSEQMTMNDGKAK